MTRLHRSALALLALMAVVLAGPIGSGGVAAAASGGGQESQLEREIDRLSDGERTELERQLADQLASAGVDLEDPAVQARLAGVLGVTPGEIERAVEASRSPTEAIAAPIVFLFVAAALLFAPSVFQSVAATLFGWATEAAGIDGVDALPLTQR
jgi:hypothetical protein